MCVLTVCIFSFNRGKFLRNCVESIRYCIPNAEIVIFDDNSNDPETREYLDQVAGSFQIVERGEIGNNKHGGLYCNMKAALDILRGRPLICFLQDDTQVVRPVHPSELEEIEGLFDRNPTLGFVHPCFVRGVDLGKRALVPLAGPAPGFFYRQGRGQSAGVHYSDLIIFKPERLIEVKWCFQQSESLNDKQAKVLFGMMAYMWIPFAMWLPEVPAYRGKKKTLGLRLAERMKRVGFYPFKLLAEGEVNRLRNQQAPKLPVAEDFLECIPYSPPGPWTYDPLSGVKFLRKMNNLELVIRRWLKFVHSKLPVKMW